MISPEDLPVEVEGQITGLGSATADKPGTQTLSGSGARMNCGESAEIDARGESET